MSGCQEGKVLALTSTLPRWSGDSTPRFVLDLVANLAELGWAIEILAPGFKGAAKTEAMEGVRTHRFSYMLPSSLQKLCYEGGIMPNVRSNPAKVLLVPSFIGSAIMATRNLIEKTKPAMVHAHWTVPMGLVATLAIPRSMPLLLTVHGSDVLDLRGSMMSSVKRRVLTRANIISCNSTVTEEAVRELIKKDKPIVRIPMGARLIAAGMIHEISLPRCRFVILFAGRLIRGKGLDDLLEAMAGFSSDGRPYLLVAGTGPEEARFRARAERMGLASDVEFVGGLEHSQLLALMSDVNAVVVPTRSSELVEAQGLVIAEAMCAGKPVIATRGGGAEDHIANGKTGLLVPPADPDSVRRAILHFMRNPEIAQDIGLSGKRYAERNLTWQAGARMFDGIYRELCKLPISD